MQDNYFYCYDKRLAFYIKEHGFSYITKAKHHKSNDLFYLFKLTDEISIVIDTWGKSKREIFPQK